MSGVSFANTLALVAKTSMRWIHFLSQAASVLKACTSFSRLKADMEEDASVFYLFVSFSLFINESRYFQSQPA